MISHKPHKISYKTIIIWLILINIIAIGAFGAIFYLIITKQKNVSSLSQELSIASQKEQRYRLLRRILADTVPEREKLNSYFVAPEKIVDFIEEIETLGTHTGAIVSFQAVNAKNNTFNLQFETEGNFDDTAYFLALLESLPIKLSFERLWITKSRLIGDLPERQEQIWDGRFIVQVASF